MAGKIVVTTCAANHLAQAKSLGESLLRHNPDYQFIIGLADKVDGRIPESYWAPFRLIEAEALNIPEFSEMQHRYNLLELNCALKSFFLDYVMETFDPEMLFFMDSDMLVFNSFAYLEDRLKQHSILLTPHITSPFPQDGNRPQEKDILKTGIYNAGFLGLKNDSNSHQFLKWWKSRMVDQCYERPKEGLNVDQNWLNLVPLYFKSVDILNHPGCNVAYWNLHERSLIKSDERFTVNSQLLLFFHYSGYSLQQPQALSRHQDRVEVSEALKELLSIYQKELVKNNHEELLKLKPYYGRQKKKGWKKLFG
ncbi:MAG: hypothetical protein ACO1OO_06185 [Flavisolibacter sp.]